MQAVVALGGALQETVQLAHDTSWLNRFPIDLRDSHYLVFLSLSRKFDGKQIDAIGVIEKTALARYGVNNQVALKGQTISIPLEPLLTLMDRVCVISHELVIGAKLPNSKSVNDALYREVDFVDFKLAGFTHSQDFVYTTTCNLRDRTGFAESVIQFLSTGKRPILIVGSL